MKTHCVAGSLLVLMLAAPAFSAAPAAKGRSDLHPPARRQAAVELAERLTRPPAPAPLPPDLQHPFNPPGFEAPEPGANKGPAGPQADAAPVPPPRPPGDREILETLAARVTPSGSIIFRGASLLSIDGKRFPVGTKFTVTYDNKDYDLELIAIERTTFTLRYRGEEITRPITKR